MDSRSSYRQILRSSALIGGASVINILIGLVRTKVAAVLLGPAGVGMIGLLQSLMGTASTLSALGFGAVGTRQIAEAAGKGDDAAIAAVRRALLWGTIALAVLGAAVFWLLRDILAVRVLHDPRAGWQIGWLAVGVALSVAAGSQAALVNGFRRIGDLARLSVASGLLSTLLGVGALLWLKESGVLLFVLAAPISSFVLGLWFVSKLEPIRTPATALAQLRSQWRAMARQGFAFMVAGLIASLGQLMVRALVQRELGPEALGQFQAALAITMTYLGLVLGAMGTDYYPRLTAAIHDHAMVNRLVNEQTEVALLLAGPVFLAMLGLAPWVIKLLYSSAFVEAVTVLRWQILGDILKVASWPLGFIILAAGDGRAFMFCESVATGIFVLFTWIGLPLIGVQATGVAFWVMYMAHLPLVYWLARRRTGFSWNRHIVGLLLLFSASAGGIFALAEVSEISGAAVGILFASVLGVYSFAQIGKKANLSGPIGKLVELAHKLLLKIGVYHE